MSRLTNIKVERRIVFRPLYWPDYMREEDTEHLDILSAEERKRTDSFYAITTEEKMSEQRIEIGDHVWYFKPFECHIHKPKNAQGYVVGADIETLVESVAQLEAERDRLKDAEEVVDYAIAYRGCLVDDEYDDAELMREAVIDEALKYVDKYYGKKAAALSEQEEKE